MPSSAIVFICERADSLTSGSFTIDMSGFNGTSPTNSLARLVHIPSHYHNRGGNFSFADGHVENRQWIDSRTIPPYDPRRETALNITVPNNPDVFWLQSRATYRF